MNRAPLLRARKQWKLGAEAMASAEAVFGASVAGR
jgi:hypothetical protein